MTIKKGFIFIFFQFALTSISFSQHLNMDDYDIFINDTLISKSDFIKKSSTLDSGRQKRLMFKPIKDGQKTIYYLNGALYGQGEIRNKKEIGFWVYWYENGKKAREGNFLEGKREGMHAYWYANGNLRGTGHFKNDRYDGKWTMYNEDGSQAIEQIYKNGELIK